jgi:hypothetical protein
VSLGTLLTIAFFLFLVVGYLYAVAKVWRGESEFDRDSPPAFWPFSVPLWRGVGRALPIQGLSVLLIIGAGIASDLVGSGSSGYDAVMAVGLLGVLGNLLVAVPIICFNRPKLLVPPPWRDDPGAVREWRRSPADRR